MTTDRELLELAAKAAGYEPQGMEQGLMYLFGVQNGWNPLNDDGDALRLAVKLKMHIETYAFGTDTGDCVNICTWGDKMRGFNRSHAEIVPDGDFVAGTRRAIVRAAAEIGRST